MQASVLTVSITTPQSWAQQNAIKHRRVHRSPRRGLAHLKYLDPKVRKAKEDLLQKAIEGQLQLKKSPTNGLILDPFQTFPIPMAGCVSQMAHFCEYTYHWMLPPLTFSRCPGLGSTAWYRICSGRSSKPLPVPALASCSEVRHLFRRNYRAMSSDVLGHFWPISPWRPALRMAQRQCHEQTARQTRGPPALLG